MSVDKERLDFTEPPNQHRTGEKVTPPLYHHVNEKSHNTEEEAQLEQIYNE